MSPIEAATAFIKTHFKACDGAILAGSVVRGEYTSTSDLDLVVFDSSLMKSYRESLISYEWPIEVFVHSFDSYKEFVKQDIDRGRPSLPRMLAEGTVIIDHPQLRFIQEEAKELLDAGPIEWSEQTIRMKRYFITDLIDDLIGSTKRAETIYITNTLVDSLHEYILRTNKQWIGSSKWIDRSLRTFDEELADDFLRAMEDIYLKSDKNLLITLAERALSPHGGFLFDGFSLGK
ncbi:nucleotidyltransferase domain-containing protein [Bacillus sp. BGMRC 2118]|nr:nucleotidyltransferase domain-containing protein [Bacillus sp. BGMRC 2118]